MNDLLASDDALAPALSEAFLVGEWRVDPPLHEISIAGKSVHLEPRVMKLLVHLAAAGGRVVSRTELLDDVWDGAIVNDEAVSRAVSELRKALGDDRSAPRYVETIPKSGYRLVASVLPLTETETAAPGASREPLSRPAAGRNRLAIVVGLLGVGALVAGLGIRWVRQGTAGASDPPLVASPRPLVDRPFTAYPGREIDPAIDVAGERVVFAWNGAAESDEYDLYVRRVEEGAGPIRITETPGFEGHPVWSPEGDTIAFVRAVEEAAAVWAIDATGANERKLFDLAHWSFGLDWFPDGRSLVVSQAADDGPNRLVRLRLDDPEWQRLTAPDSRFGGDYRPAVSPDGRWVAFVRDLRLGRQDLYVLNVETGEERRLSRSAGGVQGADWTPDSRAVLYATDLEGSFGLWRVSIDGAEPEWLPLNGQDIYNPTVASTGRFVFESISYQENLWRIDLTGDAASGGGVVRLEAQSTARETAPALSPDGTRLAFVSNRGGGRSLWLSTADGSDPRPITRPEEAVAAGPVWSPDGKSVSVGMITDGLSRPVLLDLETGRSRLLTHHPFHSVPVAWSRDGERIYLASDRDGQWNLWAVDLDTGVLDQLTTEGGLAASEDEAGARLFLTRPGDPAIYVLPLAEGDTALAGVAPRRLGERTGSSGAGRRLHWRVAGGRIYSIALVGEELVLERLDPDTGTVDRSIHPPDLSFGGFAVSDDERYLIYGRVENSESDLRILDFLP